MKMLLLFAALGTVFVAHGQHYRKPYAVPTDQPQSHPQGNVMIMGEAEARAAVLNPPARPTARSQYHYFINQVVKSYEESLKLSATESGLLIRALNALSDENPSKYAVHFRIERWANTNLDAKRLGDWNRMTAYPEYLFSHLLNDPALLNDAGLQRN